MCILFHKWGKWKKEVVHIPEKRITENWGFRSCNELWQERECNECGKIQRKIISSDYHYSDKKE